jgi:hypothetical protein
MTRWVHLALACVLGVVGSATASAQDTAATDRAFIFEGRLGAVIVAGGSSRRLFRPGPATGATLAFHVARHTWGWASVDYKPTESDQASLGRPTVGLYTLSAGMARTFGMPFLPSRWRPIELGLGLGATQTEIWPDRRPTDDPPPPDMQLEAGHLSLLYFREWRPAIATRLRLALPLGPLRLSATAGVVATYVGGPQLWDGGWEPTGDGLHYRLTSAPWSPRILYAVPLTAGFGFKF